MTDVPSPYRTRSARLGDLDAIWRLMVEVNLAEAGTPGFGFGEIENWLTGESIVIGEDVMLVLGEADALVGVEIMDSREPFVQSYGLGGVHPDHLNKGIGTSMLEWARRQAIERIPKAPPDAKVKFLSVTAAEYEHSGAVMREFGLELARYFLDMEIEFDEPPPPPTVADGVVIRPFDPEAEMREMAQLTQDGFRDHYGFVETSIDQRERRLQHYMTMTGHDPELWWVASEKERLIAFNLCEPSHEGDDGVGYVASLAVLPSHRGRGLGRALLLTAFEKFHRMGKKGAALGVDADSLTGATRLYESVGMRPGTRYALWETVLRDGEDLATLELAD